MSSSWVPRSAGMRRFSPPREDNPCLEQALSTASDASRQYVDQISRYAAAMRSVIDWAEVQRYYDAGNNRDACRARFGFKLDAWYKAIRRGRLVAAPQRRSIDWIAVQRFYDEGNSSRDCRDKFQFSANA